MKRICISILVVAAIWIFMFVLKFVLILQTEMISVITAPNGKQVYVECGDLFEMDSGHRNIVVSEHSIHGKAVTHICKDGYTAEMLNKALKKDLSVKKIEPTHQLSKEKKRKGNTTRYPVGTIAEFQKTPEDNLVYFFVGMSAFNSQLHAETTDREYVLTLQSVIEYCNARSQHFPVYMPIIGANGRSNAKTERESRSNINIRIATIFKRIMSNYINIVPHFVDKLPNRSL